MNRYRSEDAIPKTATRYMIDGELSSSESEDDYFSGEEFGSPSISTESSEPPLPIRKYDNRYGTTDRVVFRDERKRRPSCGIKMHRRVQSAANANLHRFSVFSSSTNDEDESRTTNEDDFNPIPQYSAINKPFLPPHRRENKLAMIQELSPIQPIKPVSPSCDFALPPPLSKEMREWRPKHTSSVINAPVFPTLPKTNPHHQYFASPRTKLSLNVHRYDDVINRKDYKRTEISDKSSDSSHFKSPISRRRGIITSSPIRSRPKIFRPEDFQLPFPVARVRGVKGIVFLRMSISREMLTIYVEKACYFSEKIRRTRSTYVQLEMIHRRRDQHDSSRKRASQRTNAGGERYRTPTVENTDEPYFHQEFHFNIFDCSSKDCIRISVFERERSNAEITHRKQLGCFTFQVSNIMKKAERAGCFEGENQRGREVVEINDDGYFMLNTEYGEKNNMPISKVFKSTSYTLDGPSSTSSSSLNFHSPQKMLRSSDWPPSSSLLPSRSSSAIPPHNQHEQHGRARPLSYMEGLRYTDDIGLPTVNLDLEHSTGSSSADYDFTRHRMTLPAITTTCSMSSSEGPSCSSSLGFNPSFLHPGDEKGGRGGEGEEEGRGGGEGRKVSRQEGGVRRAASFTYSPTGSLGKHNRRPQAVVGKEDEAAKRKLFGPLTKTFSYIRSKMDSAISTSSLYPTRDEVRQWESSFESLLNHKFGQMLFTQFLKKEFSSENIEFWTECEEFKKMKDGKKSTTQKGNDIYREFVAEHAPKEVNLDSDTRAATKAAVEHGCRTDTFTLAQGKIEQLMAKDSYRRFLKDKLYLDMLHNAEGKSEETAENGVSK